LIEETHEQDRNQNRFFPDRAAGTIKNINPKAEYFALPKAIKAESKTWASDKGKADKKTNKIIEVLLLFPEKIKIRPANREKTTNVHNSLTVITCAKTFSIFSGFIPTSRTM